MHFRSALFCVTSAALVGCALASPRAMLDRSTHPSVRRQVQEITAEIGCGSKGPLSGAWAVELFTCAVDQNYTCQATEMSGCSVGDPSNIDSLLVADSTSLEPLSVAPGVAEVHFKCPQNGLVQCAINFINNGTNAGNYGMRIMNSTKTDSTSVSDVYASGPTDSASDSGMSILPTDSSTDSGFGSSPTDSGFGDSASDSGFGSNPTDSGFGDSASDSGLSSNPTDTGFGSNPTDNGFGGSSTGLSSDPSDSSTDTSGNPTDGFNNNVFGASGAGTGAGAGTAGASDSSSMPTGTSGFGSASTDTSLSGFGKV